MGHRACFLHFVTFFYFAPVTLFSEFLFRLDIIQVKGDDAYDCLKHIIHNPKFKTKRGINYEVL